MRKLILSGAWKTDERIPSVRDLAAQLAINPNTIARAYRELEAEGCIYTIPGRGAFCAGKESAAPIRTKELLIQLRGILAELQTLGISRENYLDLWEEVQND